MNLNGNAIAGTEWEISGPDFSSRTEGGDDIVQQFWGGPVVAPFEIKVDIWLFDGGNDPLHWERPESGNISVTRPNAPTWSPTSDWSVAQDTTPPNCTEVTDEPALGYLGLTYSRLDGCTGSRWISPAYWSNEGIQTDSIDDGWQAGLHYVVSSSYHVELETAINPHLDPLFSAAQHPVDPDDFGGLCPDADFTFYQVNSMCGDPDFGALRDSVVVHELRHATRYQERMDDPDHDPRVEVWSIVSDSESGLLAEVRDAVGDVDHLLHQYAKALDNAQGSLWEGDVWQWNTFFEKWIELADYRLQWDGGGAP